jgi:hypothetical protein
MERRRIDEVRIALRRGTVSIPWSSCYALLDRVRNLESMHDVRDSFRAVGTTRPIRLTDPQKAGLLNIITFWANQTVDGDVSLLPKGIPALRDALHDDLHQVGVEETQDPLADPRAVIDEHDDERS